MVNIGNFIRIYLVVELGMDNKSSKVQVDTFHYIDEQYNKKERFASYWHQIDEVRKCEPDSVLEIGGGSGVVRGFIKNVGLRMFSLDIDPKLEPNVIGSVLDLPFGDCSVDVVACYQVLEHLPFGEFPRALRELARVTKKHVLISLPDVNRVVTLSLRASRFIRVQLMINVPAFKRRRHEFDGEHYWEIGKAGYDVSRVRKIIEKSGLDLKSTYRVFEHPYHRFFILTKS